LNGLSETGNFTPVDGSLSVGKKKRSVLIVNGKAYLTIMDEVDVVGDDFVQKERPRMQLPEKGIILDFVSSVTSAESLLPEDADARVRRIERSLPSGIGVAFTSFLGELYESTEVYSGSEERDTVVEPTVLRCTEDEADEVCKGG
jgi:hypothetical protein